MTIAYTTILDELEKRYGKINWHELVQELMGSIAKVAGVKAAQDTLTEWGEISQFRNIYSTHIIKAKRGRKEKTYNQQDIQAKINKEIQENIEADAYILDLEMQAENHPDGKKAFWKAEMVGKWSYGLDQHPMTEEEFEQEWKEMSNND
jgi:CRISPR/Cas system-associated protein Cas5 (RAMP superfamily)